MDTNTQDSNWPNGYICSKDNWISYRWNRFPNNPYPKNDFEIFLNPKEPANIVPMDVAAKNVVEDICQTYKGKKIFVAMSGGIDSEYIATTLTNMNIEFVPLIIEIEKYNQTDCWWAYKWCKDNSIEPLIVQIPLLEYLSDHLKYCKKYHARSQVASLMGYCFKVAEENNGVLIGGSGFHELYIPDPIMSQEATDPTLQDKVGYVFNETDITKQLLAPNMPIMFYNWSPEITLSFIAHRDPKLTTEENRFKIFKLNPRPKVGAPVLNYGTVRHITNPIITNFGIITTLYRVIGTSDSYYLGSTESLIQLLSKNKQ